MRWLDTLIPVCRIIYPYEVTIADIRTALKKKLSNVAHFDTL